MNIKNLNLDDIEEIINETEGPAKRIKISCLDLEGLCDTLNFLIQAYQKVKEDGGTTVSSKRKKIEEEIEVYKDSHKKVIDDLLGAYCYIKNDKKKLINKGFLDQQIETAIEIILTEIKINESRKDRALELFNDALEHNETAQYTTKSLFLCYLLPNVYNKYFDRNFGLSQSSSTNEFGGPGVRFIQAVAKCMGLTESGANIASAYKRERKKAKAQ